MMTSTRVAALLAVVAVFLLVVQRLTPDPTRELAPTVADAPPNVEADRGLAAPKVNPARAPAVSPRVGRTEAYGQLLDDATDEPLAGCLVRAIGSTATLEWTTDAAGRFSLAGLEAGQQQFECALGNGRPVALVDPPDELDPEQADAAALELRAAVGPLYHVELVGSREALERRYAARVVERKEGARDRTALGDGVLEGPFPASLRFAAPARARDESRPYVLTLRDDSGAFYGEVPVPAVVGELPDVLQVRVSEEPVLFGRVVWESGSPVERANVEVQALEGRSWPLVNGDWTVARTGDEARFRVTGLSAGPHAVRVATRARPMVRIHVDLVPGLNDLGDIVVAGGPGTGRIRGIVRSATGAGGIGALVQVESLDGHGWATSTIVGGATPYVAAFYGTGPASPSGDEPERSFEFDDVPPGRYRVVVVPWDGFRYEPAVQEITVTKEADPVVEILREDSALKIGLAFDVRDAVSGAPLPAFRVHFATSRWNKDRHFERENGADLVRVAPDGDLTWHVWAEGYRVASGDVSSFASLEGDPRVLPVALEPGWSADLQVKDGRDPRRHHPRSPSALSLDAPGESPLSGVRVVVDGEQVGITDAFGRLWVVREEAPERIELERDGWSTVPSPTFQDGALVGGARRALLWMVPRSSL